MKNKCIVVGVTGGIAAYKIASLVSSLKKADNEVHVLMTKEAEQFITPLTFQTLSAQRVITDMFAVDFQPDVHHVSLAKKADIFVIAPATANIIAKMAHGIADDMLSTTILATKAPILIAPAMNTGMWTAQATQDNMQILKSRGIHVIGPEGGKLACGDTGTGRMSEPCEIEQEIVQLLERPKDMQGLHVLITAGATREYLDPVRFITNESSGRMGFALAEAAMERGAEVTLVQGSTSVPQPAVTHSISVKTTQDLYDAVVSECSKADIVIQAAAPCDYRFEETYSQKMKKQSGEPVVLRMVENPDIAAEVGRRKQQGQTLVGFAAETEKLTDHAMKKLEKKNLDLIVANDVTMPGAGFNTDTNIVTLITREEMEPIPKMSKSQLAFVILDKILKLRNS